MENVSGAAIPSPESVVHEGMVGEHVEHIRVELQFRELIEVSPVFAETPGLRSHGKHVDASPGPEIKARRAHHILSGKVKSLLAVRIHVTRGEVRHPVVLDELVHRPEQCTCRASADRKRRFSTIRRALQGKGLLV